MSRVIVFTQRHDLHADRLCAELLKLGVHPFRIDAEDILNLNIKFFNNRFFLSLFDDSLSENDVISVFVRKKPNSGNFGIDGVSTSVDVETYIRIQKEALFDEMYFALHRVARFYNPFDAAIMNMGKLGQAKIAKIVGFNLARTFVGGTNEEVCNFIKLEKLTKQKLCTKPLSPKYLNIGNELFTRYTEMLPDNIRIEEEDFENCPIIFQNYIDKKYELRITVIDREIIGIKIDSQKAPEDTQVDWRKYNYPQTPHSEYNVPDDLAEKILTFHKLSGLRYSAFDFIKSVDENYYFLETNQSGQWLWLEDLTGVPITSRIASALCSTC